MQKLAYISRDVSALDEISLTSLAFNFRIYYFHNRCVSTNYEVIERSDGFSSTAFEGNGCK